MKHRVAYALAGGAASAAINITSKDPRNAGGRNKHGERKP